MNALVAKVLELTDCVEAAIEGGDWAHAQEIETARRRLLEELAVGVLPAEIQSMFAVLAERSQRFVGLVEHHRRRVLREAATVRSACDGVAAYADVTPAPSKESA